MSADIQLSFERDADVDMESFSGARSATAVVLITPTTTGVDLGLPGCVERSEVEIEDEDLVRVTLWVRRRP